MSSVLSLFSYMRNQNSNQSMSKGTGPFTQPGIASCTRNSAEHHITSSLSLSSIAQADFVAPNTSVKISLENFEFPPHLHLSHLHLHLHHLHTLLFPSLTLALVSSTSPNLLTSSITHPHQASIHSLALSQSQQVFKVKLRGRFRSRGCGCACRWDSSWQIDNSLRTTHRQSMRLSHIVSRTTLHSPFPRMPLTDK